MSKRLLLCDDEVHILRAAQIKLSRAGYEVQCADDGEAAWQAIERQVPDLLITDCQMPRLNGFQLCERVRSQPHLAELPILMLTAKGFELSADEVRQKWNVLKLITKPFSPRELLKDVDSVLNKADATTVG